MFSIIFEQKWYILNESDKFNREKIDFLARVLFVGWLVRCFTHFIPFIHSVFVTATAAANSYNPDFNFPASRWHEKLVCFRSLGDTFSP